MLNTCGLWKYSRSLYNLSHSAQMSTYAVTSYCGNLKPVYLLHFKW